MLCIYRANGAEFILQSNFGWPLWIGIAGVDGWPALANGGVELQPGERKSVYADYSWRGRFWARTGCNSDNNWCESGDCGGNGPQCEGRWGERPASLAEIGKNQWLGLDFYDISLVDGSNIPISMEPIGVEGDGSHYSCTNAQCGHDFNSDCPEELKLYRGDDHHVVGCMSACTKYGTDQYCCEGAYYGDGNCRPNEWPVNYAAFFKERCPDAYSYAQDDQTSMFACRADTYLITFG
ncbi:pathogenesis-related protein 5-like [Chrysoperla carnea]|uniref:pathogenesis-related protein 5-like n=1 Tax=Chrysoperla carnea TaxID=189513 RepID=UPI001D09960D|nr:pathogenesis-related protein 5-like [Chrysoperla carnea]